jgi:hypothetical protein
MARRRDYRAVDFRSPTQGWFDWLAYRERHKGLAVEDGEWEELRSMSWDITRDRFEGAHAGYRVAPEDAGSRVTIHMRVKPIVRMRILMLVGKPLIRRQVAADLERLKAIMEA